MRIAIYITCAIILVLAIACFYIYYYKEKRNALAEEIVRGAVAELADYKNKNGGYPAAFELLPIAKKSKQKIFFVLAPSEINYLKTDSSYRISYHIFPFGPFHGYDGKTNEWFYEE